MEKKKYQNPKIEEIKVREELLQASNPDNPGPGNSREASSSSFDDAE